MRKLGEYEERLALLTKKDALAILTELRDNPRRFAELPGNADTRSKRLHELSGSYLIEPVVVRQRRRGRPTIAYQITQKGLLVLRDAENLAKHLE